MRCLGELEYSHQSYVIVRLNGKGGMMGEKSLAYVFEVWNLFVLIEAKTT
jgi:hypothetical protein